MTVMTALFLASGLILVAASIALWGLQKKVDQKQVTQLYKSFVHDVASNAKGIEYSVKTLSLAESENQQVDQVVQQADSLLQLVRTHDTLSHISGNKLEREIFNLGDLIDEVTDEIDEYAQQQGVRLWIQGRTDSRISGNKNDFSRMLRNLIENGIKYQREDESHKEVTINMADSNRKVTLTIADNGQGIPEQYQELVFEPTFRAPGSGHATGKGLGLALVQWVISAYKGEIDLKSGPNGSVFTISFPTVKSSR